MRRWLRRLTAHVIPVGCLGHCYAEPLVVIHKPGFPGIAYHNVTPGKARTLVRTFLEEDDPLFEYMLGAIETNDLIPSVLDFPRFYLEHRLVMEHCGLIDPQDIHQYLVLGGYAAFIKALAGAPEDVIREVSASGLRGSGGAGFPTGRKWQMARQAAGDRKIVICNADEGDPGAYMDRAILESNPHQVLEGIAISAYAVGAQRGNRLHSRRISVGRNANARRPSSRPCAWVCWEQTSWRAGSISRFPVF